VIKDGSPTFTADWSELDSRVDNYILDIGQSGLSLINTLVGEKRVFFIDDQNGQLKLFRNRTTVSTSDYINLQVSQSHNKVDTDVKTRLRGEGIEVMELIDYDAIAEYGNLFQLIGLREPNNLAETTRELNFALEDALRSRESITLTGAADARLEPEDIVMVHVDDSYYYIIVVSLSMMLISGDQPMFDMTLTGLIDREADAPPEIGPLTGGEFTPGKEQEFTITTEAADDVVITLEEEDGGGGGVPG
jgi:hypothetical protein